MEDGLFGELIQLQETLACMHLGTESGPQVLLINENQLQALPDDLGDAPLTHL